MNDLFLERGATISACGRYRYRLWRRWDALRPLATFVMLNPSTADGEKDDPTIRKCIGFAQRWGMGGIYVGNLFAFRATKPADMLRAAEPVGPENDRYLAQMCTVATTVVCAWGAHGGHMQRDAAFLDRCTYWGRITPKALRLTSKGMPEHPLYVPYDVTPAAFFGRVAA